MIEKSPGCFEVDLFPKEVDREDHPYAGQFKEILEEVARQYDCRLLSFRVNEGTVIFSFDSDALTGEVLKLLKK